MRAAAAAAEVAVEVASEADSRPLLTKPEVPVISGAWRGVSTYGVGVCNPPCGLQP